MVSSESMTPAYSEDVKAELGSHYHTDALMPETSPDSRAVNKIGMKGSIKLGSSFVSSHFTKIPAFIVCIKLWAF